MKIMFVFTQNLILSSLEKYKNSYDKNDSFVFLTTHYLFENEKAYLTSLFGKCIFNTFADFLTDAEMEKIDIDAYESKKMKYEKYLFNIKREKNTIVLNKVIAQYKPDSKFILSDDLGIDVKVWKNAGFKRIEGNYYYKHENVGLKRRIKHAIMSVDCMKKIVYKIKKKRQYEYCPEEVRVAYYNNRKYVFIGKMSRIDYRLGINFVESKDECDKLNNAEYETVETCTYMTTWHEHGKCGIPDDNKYDVRWSQDGYLPPNYSDYDYHFKPNNVKYYCWDILGTEIFKNKNLPYEMIPFRKKLYLPQPVFPEHVKNVLVVASGSGDWTAMKNRSDDDILVEAFVYMAKKYPDIHFTYRCHPTWIHPENVGVNAIKRVNEYFESLALENLTLSSNMPIANENGKFQFSFSRSSLEDDLKNADVVFGEHSVSMIDAGFMKIPFASVNLTKRRNFFIGINKFGIPTCKSYDEISRIIESVTDPNFQSEYIQAIKNYNDMTDQEL